MPARFAALIAAFIFTTMLAPSAAFAQGPKPSEGKLDNGLRYIYQQGEGELASACLFIKSGPAYEPSDKSGISGLLANALLSCYPNGKVCAPVKIEQLGGRVTARVGEEYTCFVLTAPAKNFQAALKALSDIFETRDLQEGALSVERLSLLAERDWRGDVIEEKALRLFLEKSTGGRWRDFYGSEAALSKLASSDLLAWKRNFYRPENMYISMCGKFGPQTAVMMLSESFQGLKAEGPAVLVQAAAQPTFVAGRFYQDGSPKERRSAAVIGFQAPPPSSPDYAAMRVVQALLVDGMGSSIFRSLRQENQLAYSLGGSMGFAPEGSKIIFYAISDKSGIDASVDGFIRSVTAIKNGSISAEDLARAKGRAVGCFDLERETVEDRAWHQGLGGLMGLGPDFSASTITQLERIGSPDIVRAANKYFEAYSLVVLRPGRD